MTEPTSTPDGGLRAERVTEQDRRDVRIWLTQEADQRVRYFPQRRDGVDVLLRQIIRDLATHPEPVPTPDSEGVRERQSRAEAWSDGYLNGAMDERDDPGGKRHTPNPHAIRCFTDREVGSLLDEAHATRQAIGDLITRFTETGEWEHDGGCEGGDANCMACTVEDLRQIVGVER